MRSKSAFIMSAIALCAIVFVGCEKFDVKPVGGVSQKHVFDNPKWILIDDNYCDEYGACGRLYQNANNKKEMMLKADTIMICSKMSEKKDVDWGRWVVEPYFDVNTGQSKTRQYCDLAITVNQDCQAITVYSDDGVKLRDYVVYYEFLTKK